MSGDDFERIMEAWAEYEAKAPPDLRPTAKMYRMVRAREHRHRFAPLYSRPTLAAAMALTLFLLFYTVLIQTSTRHEPSAVPRIALVSTREAFAVGRGIVVKEPFESSGKGSRGAPTYFRQLFFQSQKQRVPFIEAVDLRDSRSVTVELGADDNYRLLWEPEEQAYVYVFHLTAPDILLQLFPNESYNPDQNPLRQGQVGYLPSEPHWFYLKGAQREGMLYLLASSEALPDLEALYDKYNRVYGTADGDVILTRLLERIAAIADVAGTESAGWTITIKHR